MTRFQWLFCFLLINYVAYAQVPAGAWSTSNFFTDTGVVQTTIITDIKKLRATRNKPEWLPAEIILKENDTTAINESIGVRMRGNMRKAICDIASLELNFKSKPASRLGGLKKMKLVGGCSNKTFDEELLLKEFLVYKMYNILTPLSFNARLLRITYIDSRKKTNTYTQYAFLIEDISDVCKRNGFYHKRTGVVKTHLTDRLHMSFVSIFQYMIGNTDWSVSTRHNIKLIVPSTDTLAGPFAVPYDFDYSGIVNAPYAIPAEEFTTIKTVRDRLYRGLPRTMDEIKPMIKTFEDKQKEIYKVIETCYMLNARQKKEMIKYVEDFYDIIKKESNVKRIFSESIRIM